MAMDFSKLLSQIESVTTKKSYDDEDKDQYWKLTKDKAGNASAIIRFLPNKDPEDFPFVRVWNHSFTNKNTTPHRWYIEKSLSTINKATARSTQMAICDATRFLKLILYLIFNC